MGGEIDGMGGEIDGMGCFRNGTNICPTELRAKDAAIKQNRFVRYFCVVIDFCNTQGHNSHDQQWEYGLGTRQVRSLQSLPDLFPKPQGNKNIQQASQQASQQARHLMCVF